jgi:hypothetical protein
MPTGFPALAGVRLQTKKTDTRRTLMTNPIPKTLSKLALAASLEVRSVAAPVDTGAPAALLVQPMLQ